MENKKWMWKKSSERSSGETESSGSVSSHSGRYSDDQEGFKTSPNDNAPSTEVSSMASTNCDDVNLTIKSLTEKLSAKEELAKQHEKVAEEAIAGWEKAENEVEELKKKLEGATKQNSALQDRVSHLDGALKECVRQLRQARDEQEQKIRDAIAKTSRDWETTRFEFESKIIELEAKAESVKPLPPNRSRSITDHRSEALEREISALKLELSSQLEELELRMIERDLSNQAAEIASKQHLESIKKVAKLEAECRRLKADRGKRLNAVKSDARKLSSSDSWASALMAELDQFKNEKIDDKSLAAASIDINSMDDFLEMERLAAQDETRSRLSDDAENSLRAELDSMVHLSKELEEKLKKMEMENTELRENLESKPTSRLSDDVESALRAKLGSMVRLSEELEEKLENVEMENAELREKLEKMEIEKTELEIALTKTAESSEASALQIKDTEINLQKLKKELGFANEAKQLLESQLISMEVETQTMSAKINLLESEIERERGLANETKQLLESQLSSMEAKTRTMSAKVNLLEAEVVRERGLANESKQLLESQLNDMKLQTQTMSSKVKSLEAEVKREKGMTNETKELFETQLNSMETKNQMMSAKIKLLEAEVEKERGSGDESKMHLESQLISMEMETQTMSAKIDILEAEIEKERAKTKQLKVKCQELEEELSRKTQEAELRQTATTHVEAKIKQEDLAVAAGKLAECQKTIASLGKQLNSLATLEDFLIDTASIPELSARAPGSFLPQAGLGLEPWKFSFDSPTTVMDNSVPLADRNNGNTPPSASSSSSTLSSVHASSEKNRNGFAKFFTRSKNGIHLEI